MHCCYLFLFLLVALHEGLTQTQTATLYPHDPVDTLILNSTTLGDKINNGTIHVSPPIAFRSVVPFGVKLYSTAYILSNGIVYFTNDKHVHVPGSPDLDFAFSQHENILAPFWADILPNEGQVSYRVYESCGEASQQDTSSAQHTSATRNAVFTRARQDVMKYHALSDFAVDAVLVVTWSHVMPFSNFSRPGRPEQNTFQGIFISGWTKNAQGLLSDEKTSYAIYLYEQGEMNWIYVQGRIINIGFSGSVVTHLPNTNTPYVAMLANSEGNTGHVGVSSFLVGRVNSQSERCQRYLCKYVHLPSDETYKNETQRLPQCPCSLDRLGVEWERYHKPGEKQDTQCYIISPVAKIKMLKGNALNKLCCYQVLANQPSQQDPKSSGYIVGAPYSGHVIASDPWVDSAGSDGIAAHDTCCEGASESMCARFYEIFQDNGCSSQHRFANAYGFGDPHIITFDGLTYSMNGWGEFTLMRIDTEKFYLQARTERPTTADGKPANATIFKAFAAKEEGYGHFQVELSQNEKSMLILINGVEKTQDFYTDSSFIFSNGTISVLRESLYNRDTVIAKFPCGVSVSVNVGLKNLEIEVKVSQRQNRTTKGLLGFYSGITQDDFKLPDGTGTGVNYPDRTIYSSFIKEWDVTVSSPHSVFHYSIGDNAEKHSHHTFTPMFANDVSGSHADMSFCQSDKLCMFDYVATGDREYAERTKELNQRSLAARTSLENHPPSLQVSGLDSKGFWVINDGHEAMLKVQINDLDNLPVRLELTEDTSDSVTLRGSEVVYTPDMKKPVIIGIRAVDSLNACSALTYVKIGICPGCNGRGQCITDKTGDLDYINGHFWMLKCLCQTPYTGINCETMQNACDLRPCSVGQNCSSLSPSNSLGYSCGPCPPGYENKDGKCVDLDECSKIQNICGAHACENNFGSYSCMCNNGFEYIQGSKSCQDIDECSKTPRVCQQECQNTQGGYTCSCLPGYNLSKDNSTCQLDSQHAALCSHCEQLCSINGNSAAHCTCYKGYEVDPRNSSKCIDLDECAAGIHSCSQVCVNKVGYYQCLCNNGFQLSADSRSCEACPFPTFGTGCSMRCDCNGRGKCDPVTGCVCDGNWQGPTCSADVDECQGPGTCQSGQVCHNTEGSYTCLCPAGSNLINGNCTDCQDNFYGESCSSRCSCLAHQKCDKVNGACSCIAGWTGPACSLDIDECSLGTSNCNTSAHEKCINTPGGFHCTCDKGFGLVDISGARMCKECNDWRFGLNCSQSCNCLQSNTQNCDKFMGKCYCKPGWTGVGCESDIDECAEHLHNCSMTNHEMCNNTWQSFSCGCQLGYELDTDGKTCKECGDWKFGLNCIQPCTCRSPNTHSCDKASGKCVCQPGWTGVSCESDLDECSDPTPRCSASNHEVCNNTPGSFNCSCQTGFVRNADGKTCEEHVVSTQPTPSVSINPTSLSTQPTPSVSIKPTSLSTQPNPSASVNPTPSLSLQPTPSVSAQFDPSVSTKPTPSESTNPPTLVSANPTPSVSTKPTPSESTNPPTLVSANPTPSVSTKPTPSESTNPPTLVSAKPTPSESTNPPTFVSANPTPLVSTQSIPLHVVKVNLTFEYTGDKLNLDEEEHNIKADIKSQFLGKLQAKNPAVVDLTITGLRHGSLIASTDVVLKDDSTASLDHLAQALYQVEKANEPINIRGRPVTFTEVTINSLKVDKSSSPCSLRNNFDPCKDSESCQEQGSEATCVAVVKKDNTNFIIGMSVGLFSFIVLCAVIAVLVRLWARKKKAGKDLKHGGKQDMSMKRLEKNGSINMEKSSNYYSSIHKTNNKKGDQSNQDSKVTRQLGANDRRGSVWQADGNQNVSAVSDRRASMWPADEKRRQGTFPAPDRRASLWQSEENKSTVPDRRASVWPTEDSRRQSAVAVPDRRASTWQKEGNSSTSAALDRQASMWQADESRRQSTIAVADRRASVRQGDEKKATSAVSDRRASIWPADENRRQSTYPVPDRRTSMWQSDENRRPSTYGLPDRRTSAWSTNEDRRMSSSQAPPPGSPVHQSREFNNRAYDAADSSWQSELNARNRLDSLVGTPTYWDNFQLAGTGNTPAQSGNIAKKGESKEVNRRFSRDPFLLY